MQNELLAVESDRFTGGVVKLLDKATGRDLACLKDPLDVLEYVLEWGGRVGYRRHTGATPLKRKRNHRSSPT